MTAYWRTVRAAPSSISQSDHGPGSGLDWGDAGKSDINERMSNLIAFRFPEKQAPVIPQDSSPVNSFRRIFAYYFAAPYRPLPDVSYFSLGTTPYVFLKVDTTPEHWRIAPR